MLFKDSVKSCSLLTIVLFHPSELHSRRVFSAVSIEAMVYLMSISMCLVCLH